jgi:hypothetical protein
MLLEAGHECWADGYVAEEARRNVAAKAPGRLDELERILARVRMAEAQPPQSALDPKLRLAEKDRPVLAAAVRLGCEALVTGDRTHFGALYGKTIGGAAVHSPRSLAAVLLKRRGLTP